MDNVQRFIACFLTGSFAWGMVPAAWALADVAVGTSTDATVSVESSSNASATTETEDNTEVSAESHETHVQNASGASVGADIEERSSVQLNLGQRIKGRCHGLAGLVRVRCVHEVMENSHAKVQSRFGLWMGRMRARMEEHQEKFEEHMKNLDEKEEKKVEKMHRKAMKFSPEVRARIHAEHKADVEAARRECQAKETNEEKRACMSDARVELRAKLKALIEASMGTEQ